MQLTVLLSLAIDNRSFLSLFFVFSKKFLIRLLGNFRETFKEESRRFLQLRCNSNRVSQPFVYNNLTILINDFLFLLS